MVALASTESVSIEAVEDKRSFKLFTLNKALCYPSDNLKTISSFIK